MARARNIKPGFFANDTLGELEPLARLLFIGLWTAADRAGRLEDRPKKIKATILPYDDCDVDALLGDLHKGGFIVRYAVAGCSYIQVVNFDKHQNPHKNEGESVIPPYDESHTTPEVSRTLPDSHQSNPADSLLLIPDSLIPDSGFPEMSGKPDDAPQEAAQPKAPRPQHREAARRVLAFLNQKTGKAYQDTDTNLDFVVARLKEGYTEDMCRMVIARKFRDWSKDDKMAGYLRPATLFNREKFNQYAGECVAPQEQSRELS